MVEQKGERTVAAFAVLECSGPELPDYEKTKEAGPAVVTLTVYQDGLRDVGCPYLGRMDKICTLSRWSDGRNPICVHLVPGRNR
jgi:hypothetical protein